MIKANKVVSITYSESVGGIPKLDLETHLEDPVVPELFCGADFWDGLDAVIMSKEEYGTLDLVSDFLRDAIVSRNKKISELEKEIEKARSEGRELKDEIKDLKEKLAQEAAEVDFQPNGTIVFRTKRVSELEKEVEKLKDELNKKQRVVDIVMGVVDVCSDLKERVGIYEDC